MAKLKAQSPITVAIDGTGGDNPKAVIGAVRFALAMYPALSLMVFGSPALEMSLLKAGVPKERCRFIEADEGIAQDEKPAAVLRGYKQSGMRLALEAVQKGEAKAMVSSGGTGPLVTLARHLLPLKLNERFHPALAARIPAGPGAYALMLDLGANSSCSADDLHGFACLGYAAAASLLKVKKPRLALLNVGTEQGKGNDLVRHARDLITADPALGKVSFIEGNRLFCGDTDVIITDGFTGNAALKAAEGVAQLLLKGQGIKSFFARMARPDWLLPWQYNGSLLLGVNGIVVKSHGNAGDQALAVAMVEAAKAAQADFGLKFVQQLNALTEVKA